ncbi:MAG: FHA domain-containing protein [Eubacterium sp.]
MAKFKVKCKDTKILIKSKLEKDESINQRDVDILNSKVIRGLMKPTVESERKITYLSPIGVTLKEYLCSGISKNDFFLVFAQILEVTKSIDRNSFNINNLVMNLNYVFINKATKEVHFIYQPILSQRISSNLASFLYTVADNTTLDLKEDLKPLNKMMAFIRGLNVVTAVAVENYILKVYPQIYKQVKRQKPGQSEALVGSDVYYRRNEWDERKRQAIDDEATSLLVEDNEEATSLLVEEKNEATSLLIEEDDEATTLLVEEEDEATSLLIDDDDEATSLLDGVNEPQRFPYLIRKSNFDRVDINKPVFRIGKEKRYVDYFILNNNAVSRLHADIINHNGICFIKDNNSTNGTFVNGNRIQSNIETEIYDGDSITLANEGFVFHLD